MADFSTYFDIYFFDDMALATLSENTSTVTAAPFELTAELHATHKITAAPFNASIELLAAPLFVATLTDAPFELVASAQASTATVSSAAPFAIAATLESTPLLPIVLTAAPFELAILNSAQIYKSSTAAPFITTAAMPAPTLWQLGIALSTSLVNALQLDTSIDLVNNLMATQTIGTVLKNNILSNCQATCNIVFSLTSMDTIAQTITLTNHIQADSGDGSGYIFDTEYYFDRTHAA